jgi:4'-phosphopantetheinyl transferase
VLGAQTDSPRPQPLNAIEAAFEAGAMQVVFLALSGVEDRLMERILTTDEAERARRLVAPPVRRGFVGGRYLIRSVLAVLAAVEPRSLELEAGPHGKLFLVGHEELAVSFNLSHSGDLVALALVRGRRLGIDIEAERPLTDAALLARRILGPRERALFDAVPETERGAALLAAWTRKEAVLKAIGTGISGGLTSIEVLADIDGYAARYTGEPSARWSVRALSMAPGFHGAIAIEGQAPSLLSWQAVA